MRSRRRGTLTPSSRRLLTSSPRPSSRRHRATVIAGLGLLAAGVTIWLLLCLAKAVALMRLPTNADFSFASEGSWSHRPRLLPARFPRHGTPEFDTSCRWVSNPEAGIKPPLPPANLTLVPSARRTEGIASWIPAVAQSYIYSRLLAHKHKRLPPKLLLEYGAGMNLSEVVQPPMARRNNPGWEMWQQRSRNRMHDASHWCRKRSNCTAIGEFQPKGEVPLYRHPYTSMKRHWIYEGDFEGLSRALPGFSVETGMACALTSMWEPSPGLAKYEPELFTRLLPALRKDDALVVGLYLRTQWTDLRTSTDRTWQTKFLHGYGDVLEEDADGGAWNENAGEFLRPFVECAYRLEREYFTNYSAFGEDVVRGEENAFSNIIWMVSSDSPRLKRYVREAFSQDVDLARGVSVPRRVLYTSSDGNHTKKSHGDPSPTTMSQAFVDWFLLGESDAVVIDGDFTFGTTAALRTARPVYAPDRRAGRGRAACTSKVLVRPRR